jgi:Fic family protein
VDQVLRHALGSGNLSVLLSGHSGAREVFQAARQYLDDVRLSRSLLSGLLILSVFPADRSSLRLADISRDLDMNTSTAHRYLATLLAVGLLARDEATREYRLAHDG